MHTTRLEDFKTKLALEISDDVNNIIIEMGLGTMGFKPHTLYPDMVHQFLASCRVYYADESAKVAQQGVLTFMCKGVRYMITLKDLCGLVGFRREATQATMDTEWADIKTFWSYIRNGE